MDIRDLNNYQLVLLTLLISFVTSIATGIITVSLLQQAPPIVTGAINNVIERTIEKVVPADDSAPKVQTIVIKEDDLITEALSAGFEETGGIFSHTDATVDAPASDTLTSLGVLVDANGTFVTTGNYSPGAHDFITLSGGTYQITNAKYDKDTDLSIMTLVPNKDATAISDLQINGLGGTPKPGQTALVVGINNKFVKTLINVVTPPKKSDTFASTSLTLTDDISSKMSGAPILSEDGKIVGMVAFTTDGTANSIGVDAISHALKYAVAPVIDTTTAAPAPAQ